MQGSHSPDINAVVRQHLSELLDVLVTRVEGYSQEISLDVMALLRRLIDRQVGTSACPRAE